MNREDIEVTTIRTTDTFQYAGKVFNGLEDLKYAAFHHYSDVSRKKESPYVVIVDKRYPCFDSEDYANENRYYQNYYLTTDRAKAERICKETEMEYKYECRERGEEPQYPVLEPMFSMSKIEEHHLPYIYYHGEGDFMEVVQNRNALPTDRIVILSESPFHFKPDLDPTPCLYGPPPEYRRDEDFYLDKDDDHYLDKDDDSQDSGWFLSLFRK